MRILAGLVALIVTSCPALGLEWRSDVSDQQVRSTRWGHDERNVTGHMKADVYHRDGYSGSHDPRCPCEVDHIGPRCLGGADTEKNLQIQSYSGEWNAHMKDRLEDYACRSFVNGSMSLPAARSLFEGDWRQSYTKIFGATR